MKRIPLSIEWFTNQLKENNNFSFARYGDGEFAAVFDDYITNADGVKIDAGLGKQLRAVLRQNQPYYHGLLKIAMTAYSNKIKENYNHIQWYNGDLLLGQFLEGKGKPLIQELRKKRILYVGGSHCRGLNQGFFDYVHFIEVPKSTAHKEDKSQEIIKAVKDYHIDVVGYSAGMASNIWINNVYSELKTDITQIDFGSLWDGFMGRVSRSYIKSDKVDWNELRRKTVE